MGKVTTILKIYRWPLLISAGILVFVSFWGSAADLVTVAVLAGLEITFSFDNAVINARILSRLNPFWQKIFITIGIVIAVFGVRVLVPIMLVAITSGLSVARVVDLALNHTAEYGSRLGNAHSLIATFGGIFLLMIFLNFMLEDREIKWLKSAEEFLSRIGKLENISILIALVFIAVAAFGFGSGLDQPKILLSGIIGLILYIIISTLDSWFGRPSVKPTSQLAKAGLIGFVYLEMIDASFSLDGVLGAFAITDKVLLIAAGLGIGALFVRSMTLHILHRGMLNRYRYMEHGAHYAIGILAVILLLSVKYEIPQLLTGLSGLLVIVTAVLHSHFEAKHKLT